MLYKIFNKDIFSPFSLGLEGWEKRLIISDRAHIGKMDILHLFVTIFLSEMYQMKVVTNFVFHFYLAYVGWIVVIEFKYKNFFFNKV